MKRFLGVLTVIVGIILLGVGIEKAFRSSFHKKIETPLQENTSQKNGKPKKAPPQNLDSIFVPYWGMNDELKPDLYADIYYFGITFDYKGTIENDNGMEGLEKFKALTQNRAGTFVVVRLIDQSFNNKLLSDSVLQQKVIKSTQDFLSESTFEGILLDLEMSGLSFGSTEDSIQKFISDFAKRIRGDNKKFYTALFGDTYYRARPYNVKKIGEVSDKVIVMAYDFHKARGKAGPNFPLEKGSVYPYDFKIMMHDFSKDVQQDKLEIAFGMFGYDWKKDASDLAQAYSYNKIKQEFLNNCSKQNCTIAFDSSTKEGHVSYEDSQGIVHEVWFETPESVELKKIFAKNSGMYLFSIWAYSYY